MQWLNAHRGARAFIPPSLFQVVLSHLELAFFIVGLRQRARRLPHGHPAVPGAAGQKAASWHQATKMRATSREQKPMISLVLSHQLPSTQLYVAVAFFPFIFSSFLALVPPLLPSPVAICEQSTFPASSLICVISWKQRNRILVVSISFWFRRA